MPKGERVLSPKQKDRTTTMSQMNFQMVSNFQLVCESKISIDISFGIPKLFFKLVSILKPS
jgi:hypothetical protein